MAQIQAWANQDTSASRNQRDELIVVHQRNHPDYPLTPSSVAHELADSSDDPAPVDPDFVPDEGMEAEPSASPKKKPAEQPSQNAASSSANPTSSFNVTHKKKGGDLGSRPVGYGSVDVSHESIDHVSMGRLDRPIGVEGLTAPTVTTGRLSAPEPASGLRISQSPASGLAERNSGLVDVHKGHLFALELGGPDVAENIVAQFGHFQSVGNWRAAERAALKLAKDLAKEGLRLHYEVEVRYKHYQQPDQGTQRGLLFPTGFTVTVRPYNPKTHQWGTAQVIFDEDQVQDAGQFRQGNKSLDEADQVDDDAETAYEDDDAEMTDDD